MVGKRQSDGDGALARVVGILDRPVPRLVWLALIIAASLVWAIPALVGGIPTHALDWLIYADGRALWLSTGSPYAVPPPGWDPDVTYPYLYPPTSWPLLLLTYLPWPIVLLGLIPIAVTPPRLGPAIPAFVLFALAVGPAAYFGNVNVLIAGLIVLAFRPGVTGGLSLAAATAIKMYPLALLPLLWADRRRLTWTFGALAALAISSAIAFGPGSWADFATTLLREGPYTQGLLFNPLVILGPARIVAAVALAVLGLAVGSPTLVLVGATWLSPGTTIHYLLTFTAALCVEPPLRGRDLPVRRWRSRLGRISARVGIQL
jgi:hypothetical protein